MTPGDQEELAKDPTLEEVDGLGLTRTGRRSRRTSPGRGRGQEEWQEQEKEGQERRRWSRRR